MSAPAPTSSLIERELLRSSKYEAILKWFHDKTKCRNPKDSRSMLLRYRFNLRALSTDDPVFVVATTAASAVADEQFRKDFKHFRFTNDATYILTKLKRKLATAAQQMKGSAPADAPVTVEGGYLKYKQLKYKDVGELGKINAAAAFALHLRYDYLHLDNHGLARLYTGEKDSAAEAFASAFNHHYNEYCSLFPDLEAPFGSRGSFFEQQSFTAPIVQVNPPFDEAVAAAAVQRVFTLLDQGATNVFVFTLPDWADFPALLQLENSPYMREIREWAKGELTFINHLTGQQIQPCGIVQVVLSRDPEVGAKVAAELAVAAAPGK